MNLFSYHRPASVEEALRAKSEDPRAEFIGGGTNLLDLVKYDLTRPSSVIDINDLPLRSIETTAAGGMMIGALATNTEAAYHPSIEDQCPLLAEAILAGASPQLRNMATIGGNLLQRTRCYYFYNSAEPCNKRNPGAGCGALEGVNRIHAILGTSPQCIAVHPSDMAVALAALDARIHVTSLRGTRTIPVLDFHRLPGDSPQQDTTLAQDELITAIEIPPHELFRHYAYVKVRERSSFAFALVSAAISIEIEDREIVEARVALGGVAHKPWRRPELEPMLKGRPTAEKFMAFARALTEGARGFGHNDFKLSLAPNVVVHALRCATEKDTTL